MKTAKKAILLVLCAILLVVASVMGTLAYLADDDAVTNTFTVGKVIITLDEAVVDEYGEEQGGRTNATQEYKLIPGHTYVKDPTIHVDDESEDCYLFIRITDEIAAIQDTATIAAQLDANGWDPVAGETDVFVHETIAEAGDDVDIFKTIKILGTLTNDTLAPYEGKTINVIAYAVQADGMTDVAAAWDAAKAEYAAAHP